jgi:hypothetical protein
MESMTGRKLGRISQTTSPDSRTWKSSRERRQFLSEPRGSGFGSKVETPSGVSVGKAGTDETSGRKIMGDEQHIEVGQMWRRKDNRNMVSVVTYFGSEMVHFTTVYGPESWDDYRFTEVRFRDVYEYVPKD